MAILHGDCLEVMRTMDDNSIDFVVTDPPYGLKFMGKNWDHGIPGEEYWKELLRICKPGSMLAAFGGTRTYHRLTCAIEDAGWEIRDCIMWITGQGFPKSMDVSKAIDKTLRCEREVIGKKIDISSGKEMSIKQAKGGNSGEKSEEWNRPWKQNTEALQKNCFITAPSSDLAKIFSGYGTALKPAWEPIILAMKPLEGTFAQNAEKWGVAGINIDESRIPTNGENPKGSGNRANQSIYMQGWKGNEGCKTPELGRWPSNLILDEEAAEMLDQQAGINASRFFYCAKASSSERNRGLEGMPIKQTMGGGGLNNTDDDVCGKYGSIKAPQQNSHPTVKPIALMKYILKLLAPPGNPICLDPFCGSGSTLVAAKELGINCIGIEKEAEYAEIAQKRFDNVKIEKQLDFFNDNAIVESNQQMSLNLAQTGR
jgi:DNA modification methylase